MKMKMKMKMKNVVALALLSGVSVQAINFAPTAFAAWGAPSYNVNKVVSFRSETGAVLGSSFLTGVVNSTLSITLPNFEGYDKPDEFGEVNFVDNGEDIVVFQYHSKTPPDSIGTLTPEVDVVLPSNPEVLTPEVDGVIPNNIGTLTPEVDILFPNNPGTLTPEVSSFEVYSELRDFDGTILIEKWNPQTLMGNIGDKVSVNVPTTPKGYVLTDDVSKNDYIFGKDTEAKFVYTRQYQDVTQSVVRTIRYLNEKGEDLLPQFTDGFVFKGSQNLLTGSTQWATEQTKLPEVNSPQISGYTPDKASIEEVTVKVDYNSNQIQKIKYTVLYSKN